MFLWATVDTINAETYVNRMNCTPALFDCVVLPRNIVIDNCRSGSKCKGSKRWIIFVDGRSGWSGESNHFDFTVHST